VDEIAASKVKIIIEEFTASPAIAEIGLYRSSGRISN
jgi:hypothetical protein